ncbi:MAG: PEP-CTERM sorting domain-containing protein [Planctomycetota bacterium]
MFRKVMIVLVVGFLTAGAASGNFLANPGFESPDASSGDLDWIDEWVSFGDPSLSLVTQNQGESGLQSLKMFGPWSIGAGVGVLQTFTAVEGQTWIAEVSSLNSSSDAMGSGNFCAMKIEFLDAGYGPAGGSWLAGVNVFEVWVADEYSTVDTWQRFGLGTAPAPAGTAFANYVLVEVQGYDGSEPWVPTGGSVFLDNAYFVPEPATVTLLGFGFLVLLRNRKGYDKVSNL